MHYTPYTIHLLRYSARMHLQCVPVADQSYEADWRNRDIESIIRRHNLYRITVIPFYNVTLPLYNGHPGGHMRDCTHLCWSPLLYQPIFNTLDSAMDKPIASSRSSSSSVTKSMHL